MGVRLACLYRDEDPMTEISSPVRTCTKCGFQKGLTEFYKDKKDPLGTTQRCRVCIRKVQSTPEAKQYQAQYARERYANDPEYRERQYRFVREWQARNPAKMRQYWRNSYHRRKAQQSV